MQTATSGMDTEDGELVLDLEMSILLNTIPLLQQILRKQFWYVWGMAGQCAFILLITTYIPVFMFVFSVDTRGLIFT